MGQILSNLFFDVVLLRCQKLIPRDQLIKSRFKFASLEAYFVHKTVSLLFSSIFCTGIRVLRLLLHSTGNQESQCRKKEMDLHWSLGLWRHRRDHKNTYASFKTGCQLAGAQNRFQKVIQSSKVLEAFLDFFNLEPTVFLYSQELHRVLGWNCNFKYLEYWCYLI